MRDLYAMWMKDAEADLWKKAKAARAGYDCMKGKGSAYAQSMLAMAVKYAAAAELFELPSDYARFTDDPTAPQATQDDKGEKA